MARISVLGAGSWGIALAVMLNKNGHEVKVWSHRQSQVDQMNDTHTSDKIKGVKFFSFTPCYYSFDVLVCQAFFMNYFLYVTPPSLSSLPSIVATTSLPSIVKV